MKRWIKTFALAYCLSASFAAFAGGIDEIAVLVPEMTAPKFPGGFFFGGSGYYLQFNTSNGDLDYASVINEVNLLFPYGIETQSSRIAHVKPNYTWGWGVFAGYVFPDTSNDIALNYFHFSGSESNSVSAGANNELGTIASAIAPINMQFSSFQLFSQPFINANANANYAVNQIDLVVGQFMDMGPRLRIHPNAGLRWANIHRDIKSAFTAPGLPLSASLLELINIDNNSHFSGLGPIVGVDANYGLWYGFAAVAHFDAALLIGNTRNALSFSSLSFFSGAPEIEVIAFTFTDEETRRIVPTIDGKLGINYVYAFNSDPAGMLLTMEAGWTLTNYFSAVDSLTASFATSAVLSQQSANVGTQGPYFTFALAM